MIIKHCHPTTISRKNKGVKNKFMQIHKAIKYLLIFEEDIDFSKEKPNIVEEYSEWRDHMSSMAEYCAQQAFDQFKKYNILPIKFKDINEMKLNSFLIGIKILRS